MKKYNSKKFNIKRILQYGDLNIKGFASQNTSMTASEYFDKLEQFIENSSRLGDILWRVSKIEKNSRTLRQLDVTMNDDESWAEQNDHDSIKKLEELKNYLSSIGYDQINFYIVSICNAIKSGNLKLAENMAAEAFAKFNTLVERLHGTYSVKKVSSIKARAKGSSDDSNDKILLKDAIEYLYYEEEHRKLRVLAVDDVSIVLNAITSILNPYYEVYALRSSTQVEKFLVQTTPELFLLDIEMHDVNGFELVPMIRKFEEHKDTPIIFLTGNASYNNLKGAVALGACDFITKPVDKEILLEKIEKNIVKKKAF